MENLLASSVDFSTFNVWSFLLQLAILLTALLVGNILRTQVPFIKKLLIPSSLLGGLVLLLLRLIPQVDAFIDKELMQIITYHGLGLGFAAMALKTDKAKRKVSAVKIVESGVIMAGSYLVQAIFGLIVSLILFVCIGSYFGAGLILPMGFGQGTGSALSWGSTFENSNLFEGGSSYGLSVATIGFIVASIGGVVYMNIMKRKGRVKSRIKRHEDKTVADFEHRNEICESESVDRLSIQFCFIIIVYALAFGFMCLLRLTGIKAIGDLAWGLNFLWAMLFAILFKTVLNFLKKKKIVQKHYVNNHLMDRISGFMFDMMIIAGVVAIDFEAVRKNLLLLIVTCVVGTVVTFVYVHYTTKYTYKNYEVEGFLANFGTVTGTASNGMILLREIDPNYETPAATNLVLQNIPSIIFLAPLLLTLGTAGSSFANCLIFLGVYVLLFIAYNLFLFRRVIFKKHYANKPESVWVEDQIEVKNCSDKTVNEED